MYGNGMGSSIIHLLKEKKQESVQDAAINIFGSFVVGRTINT